MNGSDGNNNILFASKNYKKLARVAEPFYLYYFDK